MKKMLFAVVIAVLGITNVVAQDIDFGVTAGYLNANAKVSISDVSVTASESGFYIGGIADIAVSEKFNIQSELLYANVDGSSGVMLPIMVKYYVSEKFNIQAGPHFDIATESVPEDFTSIGISLAAGLGYDLSENFFIEGRYSFQLNDYYTGDLDLETTTNSLLIGIGYKF